MGGLWLLTLVEWLLTWFILLSPLKIGTTPVSSSSSSSSSHPSCWVQSKLSARPGTTQTLSLWAKDSPCDSSQGWVEVQWEHCEGLLVISVERAKQQRRHLVPHLTPPPHVGGCTAGRVWLLAQLSQWILPNIQRRSDTYSQTLSKNWKRSNTSSYILWGQHNSDTQTCQG